MENETMYSDSRHLEWRRICTELNKRIETEEAPENIYDWLNAKMKKLQPIPAGNMTTAWIESFELYDQEIARRVENSKKPEAERNVFKWPWSTWNRYLDPAEGGLLVVIAGPDGVGKTCYAECIAEHWARRGQKIVFVHFELSKIIMFDRRAVRHTAIARSRLKLAGDLTAEDMRNIESAKERLLEWPGAITYLHTPGKSMELVVRELDKCIADNLCDAVVVDYLEKSAASLSQLKQFGSNIFSREGADVELLKSWSETTNVPMVVLSQFNKAGKTSDFSDLDRTMIRGAGEKTEKANVVVLLQPDKAKDGIINVRIDKNTLGPKGSFQQFFDGPNFRIGDSTK